MSSEVNPTVTAPADESCPHCGAIDAVQSHPAPPQVRAWSCTACGLDFAVTTVALSIVNALLAPELRGQAFLALLRSAVHSGMEATMPARPGGPAPKHPAR